MKENQRKENDYQQYKPLLILTLFTPLHEMKICFYPKIKNNKENT